MSKNDDAGQGDNPQNLEAGGKEPFPNLATVPGLPDRALSTAEREQLQKGLVADRTNAKYSDDELRSGKAVPPLPGQPPAAATATPSTPSAAAPAPAATGGAANAPTQEAALTSPSVRREPQGEALRTAPPAPNLTAPTLIPPAQPAKAANRKAASSSASDQVVSLTPPVASLPRGTGPAVSAEVAQIGFSDGGTSLSENDLKQLADVIQLYKESGGTVRIVGYTARDGADRGLANFNQAIDRANMVAQKLVELGIPAEHVSIETKPEQNKRGLKAGSAQVFVDY